jgi:cleavage stimulation factor subunit 3
VAIKVQVIAQNVFEAGLKRFMQEPGYVLEYADFLCRLNDDRNVRALFERALSLLPPEESIEVNILFYLTASYSTSIL